MRYKNIKTGAIVDSSSVVEGDNWKEIRPAENVSNFSKKQLQELLDKRGIKYNKSDDKNELMNLLGE